MFQDGEGRYKLLSPRARAKPLNTFLTPPTVLFTTGKNFVWTCFYNGFAMDKAREFVVCFTLVYAWKYGKMSVVSSTKRAVVIVSLNADSSWYTRGQFEQSESVRGQILVYCHGTAYVSVKTLQDICYQQKCQDSRVTGSMWTGTGQFKAKRVSWLFELKTRVQRTFMGHTMSPTREHDLFIYV